MDETDRALIAAGASLVVAIIAGCFTAFNGRRVAKLTSELEGRRSAANARQEYEYEARKRLYAECQPLVFQANEMAANTRHRVVSLARSARDRQLPKWLAEHGYYFLSTVYFLLAPVTSAKLLQRRLTAVDLGLDAGLQRQYEVLKQVFKVFTDSFDLAAREPRLSYDPDRADPGEADRDSLLRKQPAVYRRQGFYLGVLEVIAEAMIKEEEGIARCASYGEFLLDWRDRSSKMNQLIEDVDEVFLGFHPRERPVLWRVLIAQSLLADLVVRSQEQEAADKPLSSLLPPVQAAAIAEYDWRPEAERDAIPQDAVVGPLMAVHAYLTDELARLDRRLGLRAAP
jgi:hypothetical protein